MEVLSASPPFHRPESYHQCPAYDRRAFEAVHKLPRTYLRRHISPAPWPQSSDVASPVSVTDMKVQKVIPTEEQEEKTAADVQSASDVLPDIAATRPRHGDGAGSLTLFADGGVALDAAIARVLSATTHYAALDVTPDASERDLKLAYRSLMLRLHPDKCSHKEGPTALQKVCEAERALFGMSEVTRCIYHHNCKNLERQSSFHEASRQQRVSAAPAPAPAPAQGPWDLASIAYDISSMAFVVSILFTVIIVLSAGISAGGLFAGCKSFSFFDITEQQCQQLLSTVLGSKPSVWHEDVVFPQVDSCLFLGMGLGSVYAFVMDLERGTKDVAVIHFMHMIWAVSSFCCHAQNAGFFGMAPEDNVLSGQKLFPLVFVTGIQALLYTVAFVMSSSSVADEPRRKKSLVSGKQINESIDAVGEAVGGVVRAVSGLVQPGLLVGGVLLAAVLGAGLTLFGHHVDVSVFIV